MFTVKVYRTKIANGPQGGQRIPKRASIYQCRSVEIHDDGVLLMGFGNSEDEAWISRPNENVPEADDTDWCVSMIVVENALGKTTEVIHA